jgi:hypothetical protein
LAKRIRSSGLSARARVRRLRWIISRTRVSCSPGWSTPTRVKAVGELQTVLAPFSSSRLTVTASAVTRTRSTRRAARSEARSASHRARTSRPRNGSTGGAPSTSRKIATSTLKAMTTAKSTTAPCGVIERCGAITRSM